MSRSLVRIEGTRHQLLGIKDVDGLDLSIYTAKETSPHRWQVYAHVTAAARASVEAAGPRVSLVKREDEVDVDIKHAYRDVDARPVEEAKGRAPYPRSLPEISAVESRLFAEHETLINSVVLPHPTADGRSVGCLRISNETCPDRIPVLLVGGIHARELAPPAALLSFSGRLCAAFSAGEGMTLGGLTITPTDIQAILNNLDLYVLPMANPDGRYYNITVDKEWRKSRHPLTPGAPACSGTDINRNFDIAWDYERYYNAAGEETVSASKDPCHPEI